ncbi:MAG TPA: cellulase family glycosylhydrolase [Ktedonobacterales bacterium]|jgi:hypothetical protein
MAKRLRRSRATSSSKRSRFQILPKRLSSQLGYGPFRILGGLVVALLVGFIGYRVLFNAFALVSPPPVTGYTVSGKQILLNGKTAFTPYGMQLGGITMAVTNWSTNKSSYITSDMVAAAKNTWHSNTVSLQLASVNVFDQAPYDSAYMARVDQIVTWATQQNMNIILVLQYEATSQQRAPTADSVKFWDFISKRYANRPQVMFDLFNEPTASLLFSDTDSDQVWNFWQNGGTVKGTTYVGMQQLVDTIRSNAPSNLIFADGLAAGEDIALLPKHLLKGSNIVYAIHPYISSAQHGTVAQWDNWFGKAAASGNFPVVADEWSEYQTATDAECYPGAAATVPTFLTYLQQKHIGLIGYALYPGTLIRGWNFTDPTGFDQPPYTCPSVAFPNMDANAQGAGQLLVNYFNTYSKPL